MPFFIPHQGCPHECAFCNQWNITGHSGREDQDVAAKVQAALASVKAQPGEVEAAFYGGSFTGLSLAEQLFWLEQAFFLKKQGLLTGIRLSTRPDYISEEILDLLWAYGVTTIELGVQSLDDRVLLASRRGHIAADTERATALIRRYPFALIYQLMPGLPQDTPELSLHTAKRTVLLHPDGARIYPTVVLEGTALAGWYRQGLYQPWSLPEAVEASADMFALFSLYGIPVIRLGLQATESLETQLLAGPWHPAFGELVKSRLMIRQARQLLRRLDAQQGYAAICFHPGDMSKVLGQGRANAHELELLYPGLRFDFLVDNSLKKNDLKLLAFGQTFLLTRQEFLEKYRIEDEN